MSTASAPLEIGHVALTVRDLAGTGDFYARTLGLERLGGSGEVALWGAGDTALIELRGDRAARVREPSEAGLFHTAFLLPTRAALGAWLRHVAEARVPLEGASDHLVSEAIYLSDPEGNGIEVYADRPRETWTHADGRVKMATLRLDLQDVAAAAESRWTGAPDGTVVGHVHLQVGDVAEAEAFYGKVVGLGIMAHYPGAAFFGSGGYHHHLGANVWHSRGSGQRQFPSTGLAELGLRADEETYADVVSRAGGDRFDDPWATPIALVRKAA